MVPIPTLWSPNHQKPWKHTKLLHSWLYDYHATSHFRKGISMVQKSSTEQELNLYGSGRQLYDAEVLQTPEVAVYGRQTQLYDPQLLRKQKTRNKITKTTSSVITTAEYSSHYCYTHTEGTTCTIYTHIYMQKVLQNTKTDFLSPQHNPISPGNAPRITINPEKHKLGLPNTT